MSAVKKTDTIIQANDFDSIELTDTMFKNLSHKMYELSGVDMPMTPKNHALIRNRIVKLLRSNGFSSYEQYWDYLKSGESDRISEFISALTTNMTSFYRESTHFDFLKETLPKLKSSFSQEFRIWCAAASTGQEPYTIAISVAEVQESLNPTKVRILATDIDLQVLKKASLGTYDDREMDGLPLVQKTKYFDKVKIKDHELWRVKRSLHENIRFAPFNLTNPIYEFKNKFHIIFCRNVMIYFDDQTKKKVLNNLVESLAVGGFLILGHSESGNIKHSQLMPLSRAIYQKI